MKSEHPDFFSGPKNLESQDKEEDNNKKKEGYICMDLGTHLQL